MIIREQSTFRFCWDVLVLALVVLSCVLVPYQLAFVHSAEQVPNGLMFAISLVFLVDIGLNFNTSYREAGSEIVDPAAIREHYMRGHFTVDLLASIPFGMLLLVAGNPQVGAFSAVLLVRLLVLLRLARFFVILGRWESFSWTDPAHLRVLKYMGMVLIFAHCIACLWLSLIHI